MAMDFSGQRLRGRRFRGDLRGANFRGADLCGASFRGADLTGADFSGARLGRGGWRRWAQWSAGLPLGMVAGLMAWFSMTMICGVVSIVLDASAGGERVPNGGMIAVDFALGGSLVAGLVVALTMAANLGRFWGFGTSLAAAPFVAMAWAALGSFPRIRAAIRTGAEPLSMLLPSEQQMGVLLGLAAAFLPAVLIGFGAVAVTGALAGGVAVTSAATVVLTAAAGLLLAGIGPEAMAGAGIGALSLLLLGWYLRHRALAEDPQFPGLRRWALAVATWSGTDFRDATLAGADCSGACWAFARLGRTATLVRACFLGAQDLHLAHVRGTILADRRVRELLVSGEGAGADLDHADLHGVWLAGATLRGARFCDAELTGADLSGADLTDAVLSRATLIGADLRGATLTGALLDGWNLDTETRLDGVKADYVYLEAGPDGDRRERRPQSEAVFGPGDFSTLFTRALKTVDLIFRNGIDWTAFRAAFDDLHKYYADFGDGREREVRVQSIENTADGRLVVRVAVPDAADKDTDHRRLSASYEGHIAALEHERELLRIELAGERRHTAMQERHNAELVRMIDAVRAQPVTIHNLVQNAREAQQMTGGDSIHQSGNFSGSIVNVKSSLSQVSQSIGALPGLDESGRARLESLLKELAAALARVPPGQAQEARAVEALTADLIAKAGAEPPNPPLLRISAEGVLKAARSLAETAAPVIKLVEQVVGLLGIA